MSYFETNQLLRADVATLRWAADRLDAEKIEPDHVYGLVLAIQALREWADDMARTAPASPVAAVPAPVQGADPTGPQEAADRELGLLREDNEMAEVMLRIERRNVNRWEQKHNTQRERADKAEAEATRLRKLLVDRIVGGEDEPGDDPVAKAMWLVARRFVAADLAYPRQSWEDYPEVGEGDFEEVESMVAAIRQGLEPAQADYDAAYALLAGRAEEAQS